MNDLDLTDDLHDLMDRVLADTEVPTARIHEGALRAGRQARRRRRALSAVGALSAAAVVGALALPSLAGGDGSTGVQVAQEPSSTADTLPPGWWAMPGAEMRDRLGDQISPELTVTDANLGDEDLAPGDKPQGGWVVIDVAGTDQRPVGGINVILYPPAEDDPAFVELRTSCPGNLGDTASSCTVLHDDDGNPIGRTSRTETGGVVVVEATHLQADGGLVYVAAANSSDDKWGAGSSVDSAEPPLTIAQVKAIALSSTWSDWEGDPQAASSDSSVGELAVTPTSDPGRGVRVN